MASRDVAKALMAHGLACTLSLERNDVEMSNESRCEKVLTSAIRFAKTAERSSELDEALSVVKEHCLVKRVLEGHIHDLAEKKERYEEEVRVIFSIL